MFVKVQLFAKPREIVKQDTVTVELGTLLTVEGLRTALAASYPPIIPTLANCRFAVNHELADESLILTPGDEVALIPPVSGG